MVTITDADAMAPAWQPLFMVKCPDNHWHAHCIPPCNWQFSECHSAQNALPIIVSKPQATQERTPSPTPLIVPDVHEALDALRQHRVAWDVTESHLKARCITSRGTSEPIPDLILNRPATRPATRNMRMICDSFPWDILIHIPESEVDKVITVGLVLEAIHGVMREELDIEDWERMSDTLKKKVYAEMCARLSRAEPTIKATVRVLKIDSLLGRTEFMGIECVDPGQDKWSYSLGSAVG